MAIVLDIIMITIVALTIFIAAAKGFIKTVFDLFKFIVSVIMAIIFKGPVAQFIISTGIYEKASSGIRQKLADAITGVGSNISSGEMLETFKTKNPELVRIIESMGGNIDEAKKAVETATLNSSENVADLAARHILEPALEGVSHITAFILIFISCFILLCIAEFVLSAMFKLPILSSFNKVGGILLGIVCAILYVSLFVSFTSPFVRNPQMINGGWDSSVADKTIIYSYFEKNNIISGIVSGK
ncbi:MAG: CvpA family protein [Clostridia bacterium]|nr:CvpA family protein [Clostridia bacterium]